jgi:hypothetical protein
MKTKLHITVAIAFLLSFSAHAGDYEDSNMSSDQYKPSAEQMIVDGLIYRPLSLAGTIIGTGLFIVTLPFSLMGDNVDVAAERLVKDPASATFDRCLGCPLDY